MGAEGTREMRVRSGPGPVGAALSSDLDARAARVGRCPAAAHQVSLSPARAASARVRPAILAPDGLPRERSDGRGAVDLVTAQRKIGKGRGGREVTQANFAFSSARPPGRRRRWSAAVKPAACDRSRSDVYSSACFLVVESDGDCDPSQRSGEGTDVMHGYASATHPSPRIVST